MKRPLALPACGIRNFLFHIEGMRVRAENPRLFDRLRGPGPTETARAVRRERHERKIAVVRFNDSGQEFGDCRSTGRADRHGATGGTDPSQRKEGGAAFLEMVPAAQWFRQRCQHSHKGTVPRPGTDHKFTDASRHQHTHRHDRRMIARRIHDLIPIRTPAGPTHASVRFLPTRSWPRCPPQGRSRPAGARHRLPSRAP